MLELNALSYKNPENNELKTQLEQKNKLLNKKMNELEKTESVIEIEKKNLSKCNEFKLAKFAPAEFGILMENWKLMAMRYPSNRNYVYNYKLLSIIMLK